MGRENPGKLLMGSGYGRRSATSVLIAAQPQACCAVGSWGGRRPSLEGHVTGTGATDGASAFGGC
jgi:hypothetical protein